MPRQPSRPDRRPRPPRIPEALDPLRVEELREEERYRDAALDASSFSGAQARAVSIGGFTLSGGGLPGSVLDRLALTDGTITSCDLANLVCTLGNWTRVRLTSCRLTGAAFPETIFEDVVFQDCRIDLASFRFARLHRVRFEDCRLDGTDFAEAVVSASGFQSCSLTELSVRRARFAGSFFRDCRMAGLDSVEALRGVTMTTPDVLELTQSLAAGLGIVIDDDVEV